MRSFDFGKNWKSYSENSLDRRKLEAAALSLKQFFQTGDLRGSSFLDIGCGSGIFSIAARSLGADRIVGVDISAEAVRVSNENASAFGAAGIEFVRGDALDGECLRGLGVFDVVYAWGSLHHTGRMHEAIELAGRSVKPRGLFGLAIYNRHFSSGFWKLIKKIYGVSPVWFRKILSGVFFGIIFISKFLVTFENPLKKDRGMDFYHDVVDWIGGYPYEYATAQEVIRFVEFQGFKLKHLIRTQTPIGNNQFVFVKDQASPSNALVEGHPDDPRLRGDDEKGKLI